MVKQIEDKNIEDRFREDWTYEQRIEALAHIGRQIEERLAAVDERLDRIERTQLANSLSGTLVLTRLNMLGGSLITIVGLFIAACVLWAR